MCVQKTSDAVENGDIRSEASLSEDAVTATQVEDTKPAQPNPKTQVAAFTPPKVRHSVPVDSQLSVPNHHTKHAP